ncbi:MAG: hypothetical protein ACRC6C_05385 [Wolbachia pipientis]
MPVFLFDVSPGFVRPIPLSKPDLDLLSNSLKDRVPFVQTHDRGKEDIENLPKQEVNKEDKKAKPEEPKKEVCPQKVPEKRPVEGNKQKERAGYEASSRKLRRANLDNSN